MEIRHLKTLIAVADAESFASAAEQLFVTPAAVSQQIRQLEEELQVELFDRAIRPPRLNTQCEDWVKRAREIVEQFEAFKTSAPSQEVQGLLSIGSVNGIMVSLLPETLRSLTRRYPLIRLRISEGPSMSLIRRVKRRELDAAIVTDPSDLPDALEAFPIFSEPLVVISHQDAGAHGWRDIVKTTPLIKLNTNTGVGRLIDASLRRFRLKPKEGIELDSSDSVVQLVLAGMGCGIVPSGRISADAARNLKTYPFGEPQVHRQVALIQRRSMRNPQLTQLLHKELLVQAASRL